MSHLDDSSRDAGSTTPPPGTPEARSRRLHEEFEAYYAEREHRRLTAEAAARRARSRSRSRRGGAAAEEDRRSA